MVTLVEVEVSGLFAELGVLFGLLQQFVEFAVEYVTLILFVGERFLEGLFAASGFAFQFGDGGGEILDRGGLNGLFVGDHGAQGRVDFEGGLAAGAGDLEKFAGHVNIIYRIVRGRYV